MAYEEAQSLNGVARFHRTFKHPILHLPEIPNEKRAELRVSLLQEELNEFKKAIEDKNLLEVADALCDLQYVLSGAVLEFGLGDAFAELFAETQRSNMSKACASYQEAQDTIDHYEKLDQPAYGVQQPDGTWLIFRKSDDKTLKSVSYSPVNYQPILDKYDEI